MVVDDQTMDIPFPEITKIDKTNYNNVRIFICRERAAFPVMSRQLKSGDNL